MFTEYCIEYDLLNAIHWSRFQCLCNVNNVIMLMYNWLNGNVMYKEYMTFNIFLTSILFFNVNVWEPIFYFNSITIHVKKYNIKSIVTEFEVNSFSRKFHYISFLWKNPNDNSFPVFSLHFVFHQSFFFRKSKHLLFINTNSMNYILHIFLLPELIMQGMEMELLNEILSIKHFP